VRGHARPPRCAGANLVRNWRFAPDRAMATAVVRQRGEIE